MSDGHAVVTPEKVVLSYNLAGLGSRIWAKCIDIVLYTFILQAMVAGLALIQTTLPFLSDAVAGILIIVVSFLLFAYFILCEAYLNGQTLGKKLMRLRVLMVDGTPVTPLAAFYRNIILIADMALFFISIPVMFLSEKGQRPGDFPAQTLVVHEPAAMAGQAVASPHRYGIHPHEELVGPLKGMTMEEYLAIKRLCDRFPDLSPAVQDRSIEEIWTPFARRFKIPAHPNIHPIYLMEATVMKYGRMKNLV